MQFALWKGKTKFVLHRHQFS